jgi:hypothetical protein
MRTQIYSASSEMEASIIRGYLENAGISATIAPGDNNFSLGLNVPKGPNVTHGIFVEENKIEEAKNLLSKMS